MAYQDTNPFGVLATQTSQSPAAAGSPPQVQLLGTGADEPQEVVIEVSQNPRVLLFRRLLIDYCSC